jgi:hypothetical protein
MYPIVVPIVPTGSPPPGGFGLLFILVGGMSYMLYKKSEKTYQMKITKATEYTAGVNIRSINYPNLVKITNHNLDCLERKGYDLNKKNNHYFLHLWSPIVSLNKAQPISTDELVKDCRECNVSTEIYYKYDSFLHNEVNKKIKFEWANCVKDEIQ